MKKFSDTPWRYDTLHNYTQHNDTRHDNKKRDTQHNDPREWMLSVIMLSVVVLIVAAPFLLCSCSKNAFHAFIFSWKYLKKNYFPTFGVFLRVMWGLKPGVRYEPEASSLNKSSCLARALGVTKFRNMRDMILVALCCAT